MIYDTRKNSWGNALQLQEVIKMDEKNGHVVYRCYGHHNPRPKDGDECRVAMKSGNIAVGTIKVTEYCRDPADMWFGELTLTGYEDDA